MTWLGVGSILSSAATGSAAPSKRQAASARRRGGFDHPLRPDRCFAPKDISPAFIA
jgi:hypothetical protein